jgi:hypothetical protein
MSKRIIPDEAKQLRKAQDLIRDEEDWCKGSYCYTDSKYKARYCAAGALMQARRLGYLRNWTRFESMLHVSSMKLFGHLSIVDVNDMLGHEAVMQCYDDAINTLIEEANTR